MTDKVVYGPFKRTHLNEMAEDVRDVLYKYVNRASVAEVLGILEIVKQEVYRSAFEDNDDV